MEQKFFPDKNRAKCHLRQRRPFLTKNDDFCRKTVASKRNRPKSSGFGRNAPLDRCCCGLCLSVSLSVQLRLFDAARFSRSWAAVQYWSDGAAQWNSIDGTAQTDAAQKADKKRPRSSHFPTKNPRLLHDFCSILVGFQLTWGKTPSLYGPPPLPLDFES